MHNHLINHYEHVTISWLDEQQTIIYVEAQRGWQWDETYAVFDDVNSIVAENLHPTYVIVDMSSAGLTLPRQKKDFIHIRRLMMNDPSHEVMTIFITRSQMLTDIVTTVRNVYRKDIEANKIKFVVHIDEAMNIVKFHQERVML
jgi:hypothetical protein